jgi:hypothetical protein
MSTAQAERAISQLYESDSLRSELRDEEASLLLMWGEARLKELAEQNLADDQFDQVSEKFRSLLATINVCVGKRKTTPSQHLPMMASISSAAQAAGLMLTPDDQTTFLKAQSTLTNQDAISELLGLLKPFDASVMPSANTSQAAAESAASAPEIVKSMPLPQAEASPAPATTEANQPAQPEDLPRPEPAQNESESAPTIPAEHIQPPQAEELPASQSVGEAPAGIATTEPTPPSAENAQPAQPEDLPRPEPADEAAEITPPQPPPEQAEPQQPEDLPRPEPASESVSESQPPQSANIGEAAEIITPQPPPATVDHTQPPQPEDLPEFPKPSPPQEGTHDV